MKTLKSLALAVASVLSLALVISCEPESLGPVEKGLPTKFTLNLVVPVPTDVTVTKATDIQETAVERLALLFYSDKNTSTPILIKDVVPTFKEELGDNNYLYTITCDGADADGDVEVTSGDWYVYAVANYNHQGFGVLNIDDLKNVSFKDLDNFLVSKTGFGLNDIVLGESALLMSGKFGKEDGKMTLLPYEGSGENPNVFTGDANRFHLRRITAKVTFTFESGRGVTFQPTSWSIYNYPKNTTLFERTGWVNASGASSEENGTFVGRISPVADAQYVNIENLPYSGSGFMFYMLENALAAKSAFPEDNYIYREKRNDDYDTFSYAPENGTYVVVNGNFTSSEYSGTVTYTIHLGNFSTSANQSNAQIGKQDNFVVRRNTKYNYKVTVNGVNKIVTEATVGTEEQPGAEGDILGAASKVSYNLDSHFETVMIEMPSGTSFTGYSLRSSNPYESVTYIVEDGKTEGTMPSHVEWIKFAKPSSGTAFSAYPGSTSDKLGDVYALIEDIKTNGKNGGKYYLVSGGKYYTQAFVNEYYYDGESDLLKFVNASDRQLTLASRNDLSTSPDGHSSYFSSALFSISQKSIKTMYDISQNPSGYNPFGLETVEESGPLSWSGSKHGSSNTNGQTNTVSIVGSGSWSTYVSTENNGHLNGGDLPSSALSRYGSYANYACLTRNRDENGNGRIDADEVKWYLPARDQAMTIIYGRTALGDVLPQTVSKTGTTQPHEALWYWCSSSGTGLQANYREFTTSGQQLSPTAVRCVRSLGSVAGEPTTVTKWNSATNTMEIQNLNKNAVRENRDGEYIEHYSTDPANAFPKKFQFAKNELSVDDKTQFSLNEIKAGTWCQDNYYENADKSDLGKWRIPNQLELLTYYQNENTSVYRSRNLASKTQFFVNVIPSAQYYFVNVFHIQTTGNDTKMTASSVLVNSAGGENASYYRIRCVRDVE